MTLFPNEVTFRGSWRTYVFGGQWSTHSEPPVHLPPSPPTLFPACPAQRGQGARLAFLSGRGGQALEKFPEVQLRPLTPGRPGRSESAGLPRAGRPPAGDSHSARLPPLQRCFQTPWPLAGPLCFLRGRSPRAPQWAIPDHGFWPRREHRHLLLELQLDHIWWLLYRSSYGGGSPRLSDREAPSLGEPMSSRSKTMKEWWVPGPLVTRLNIFQVT